MDILERKIGYFRWRAHHDVLGALGHGKRYYLAQVRFIGYQHDDTVKPGLAMILDPFGEVLVESRSLEDDVVIGVLTPDKIEQSSGQRYLKARRPELYGKMVEPQKSETLPGWRMEHEAGDRDALSSSGT